MSDLKDLIERVEAADPYRSNELILEVLPYFGREGCLLPRAGYRQRRIGTIHWNAWLAIFRSLDDVRWLLGNDLPDIIPSDPRKAVAAALRAIEGRG